MRYRAWFGALGIVAVAAISSAQSGCDAQSAAMGLFAKKGLNLLSPARDYIQPGGLVFLAKGGHPEYDDLADSIGPENGNLTDFKADIMQEAQKKTARFSAALSLAKTILPMSFSADAQNDEDVSLKEIATTGVRLSTSALDALILKPNTAKAASQGLSQKLQVFVVQEVYKATTLDLSADRTRGFSLKYNNGDPVDKCTSLADSTAKKDTSPTAQKGTSSGKKATGGTAGSGSNTAKKGTAAAKGTGQGGANPVTSLADSTSKLQAGVSVCLADNYTLKMNAKEPIPFAVRLAELQLSGTKVGRKIGSKTIRTSLGGKKSEIASDVVDSPVP